jgi:hypothetical protein
MRFQPLTAVVRRARRVGVSVCAAPAALLSSVATLVLVAACGGSGAVASFDPAAPCDADVRIEGAFPALEAEVPSTLGGVPPDRLDSGRNCTPTNLGTLGERGFDEIRFAGGLWERGARSGTTLALFAADGLTPDLMAEWFEAGARSTTDAENEDVSRTDVGGRPAVRIDALVDEVTFQTVLVWSAPDDGVIRAALVGTEVRAESREAHEAAVDAAVAAFEGAD